MNASVLQPPDYTKDYSLYVVVSLTVVSMVLVQKDMHDHKHVIYYLSKSLLDSKIGHSHVDKLALSKFITVQKI